MADTQRKEVERREGEAPAEPPREIPADWLAEFEAAARRPLEQRFKYSFIKTYKPVMDDATYRSFDTMEDYRRWCEENLPDWLGYGRAIRNASDPESSNVMPTKLDYRNIEKDPARCGGQAVVSGTRIRVSILLGCYRQGMRMEDILQQYPQLKPADVHDALAYAYDHPEEIEADIAGDDESAVQQKWPGGPGRKQ